MQRRQFISLSLAIGLISSSSGQLPQETKVKPKGIPLTWHDPETWGVEGRLWEEQPRERWYDRLPASAQGKVTKPVWDLSRHSAGMAVRFRTDSPVIQVRYTLSKNSLAMPHMPATGASGVDLYAKDPQGKWKWVAVTKPSSQQVSSTLVKDIPAEAREWMMYLPLFNGIETLQIGVAEGASFEGLPPRKERQVIFYGTSITHGACASRPGMTHVSILGRRLDSPVVNLGFSGNGKMDASVGEYLAQTDPAVFVIDCLPNMSPAEVTARTIPLVKQLRAARPQTPILLVESRRNTESWIDPKLQELHTNKHSALKAEFEKLKAEGIENLHYLKGDDLLGDDADGATDGSHPNDLGFFRQSNAFEPILKDLLKH